MISIVERFYRDLRFASRLLWKDRAFTLAAVLALALGIGGNTAIFSVVDSVLMRPLPYKDSDQLVALSEIHQKAGKRSVSWWDFLDWQKQCKSISQMAAIQETIFNITGDGDPERLIGANVSGSFFQILGITPYLGNTFTQEQDRPGGAHAVVIAYSFWKRKLQGDPNAIGRNLTLNGHPYTIAAVLSPSFQFTEPLDIFAPIWFAAGEMGGRGSHPNLAVIGRLASGTTLRQASDEMSIISSRLAQLYPVSNAGESALVQSLADAVTGGISKALMLLMGAVMFVLLIACVNVANLLLARSAAREREIALRRALGASRERIVCQMITENLLLAFISSLAGIGIAYWSLGFLVKLIPEGIRNLKPIQLDFQVFAFTIIAGSAAALLFGTGPALYQSKADCQEGLRANGRTVAGGRQHRWARTCLVISEIALATVLLIGAGLVIRSLQQLRRVDLGFRSDHILTLPINLPPARYHSKQEVLAFYARLFEGLQRNGMVASAGVVECLPIKSGDCWSSQFTIDDRPVPRKEDMPFADFNIADSGYFRAVQIPLLAGRMFDAHDTMQSEPVVLVNETMARRYWPNQNPIGRHVRPGASDSNAALLTVIGVAGDAKRRSIEGAVRPELYYPITQAPAGTYLVVRSVIDPAGLTNTLRRQLNQLDPNMAVHSVDTLEHIVAQSTESRHLPVVVLSIFAGLALILATVGVYGLTSYSVVQRVQEIGIRMALGAQRTTVVFFVLREGLIPVAAGLGIGIVAAFGLTRIMASLLYGISATDPAIFSLVPFILMVVVTAALLIPARRAAMLDPATALRRD
jgi:putative ABC transport system permease protein